MNRQIPFAALFAMSLVLVALLPLYVEQTMTRVMFVDGRGEAIEWGWKLCTLQTSFPTTATFVAIRIPSSGSH